jgi:hypothetical protein
MELSKTKEIKSRLTGIAEYKTTFLKASHRKSVSGFELDRPGSGQGSVSGFVGTKMNHRVPLKRAISWPFDRQYISKYFSAFH